eukprot:scaffold7841_cov128-Isochrysis_galbana.AAC.16
MHYGKGQLFEVAVYSGQLAAGTGTRRRAYGSRKKAKIWDGYITEKGSYLRVRSIPGAAGTRRRACMAIWQY